MGLTRLRNRGIVGVERNCAFINSPEGVQIMSILSLGTIIGLSVFGFAFLGQKIMDLDDLFETRNQLVSVLRNINHCYLDGPCRFVQDESSYWNKDYDYASLVDVQWSYLDNFEIKPGYKSISSNINTLHISADVMDSSIGYDISKSFPNVTFAPSATAGLVGHEEDIQGRLFIDYQQPSTLNPAMRERGWFD